MVINCFGILVSLIKGHHTIDDENGGDNFHSLKIFPAAYKAMVNERMR